MAEAAFAPWPPPLAQDSLGPAGTSSPGAAELRRSFMHDGEVRTAFRAVIEALGLDPASTYADRLILRLQPSGDAYSGRRVRDSSPAPRHLGLEPDGPDQPLGPGVPARSGARRW